MTLQDFDFDNVLINFFNSILQIKTVTQMWRDADATDSKATVNFVKNH